MTDYRNLPEEYLSSMQELLGEEYPDYLNSFDQESAQGLRVNVGKTEVKEFLGRFSETLTPVPWTANGFYTKPEAEITKHPYYYAGLYYVQEPSAMLPAARLKVCEGDRVLDLCAAPGGKATELGSHIGKDGILIANDISHSRAMGLLKNLELFGVGRAFVCSETPQKLADKFPLFFDKVLIDAPCSGEGMFRKDASMVKTYQTRRPGDYAPLQSEILEYAVQMLRPGGQLLYSTCTFSELENEAVIEQMLQMHPEMHLLPMEKAEGFADGRRGLTEAARLFPHRIRGEGHFAVLLQKDENVTAEALKKVKPTGSEKLSKEAKALWEEFDQKYLKHRWENVTFVQKEERIYAVPSEIGIPKGLRFLRTGLYLGDVQKKRFEPSQALAMYLNQEEAKNTVSFSPDDARTWRYLKGETIELTDEETPDKGWCLVCVDGFPLGWAKNINGTLRNKYYPGWRVR
ncbi:MAG: RsmF rRNA methyltransferase first C-terminal domain-containing protein [Eubacteriales bacterium]|nr:RsmF rRNA methyltransferase first C-terminal domain-containing protein [Eubacteriales bacterium]